METENEMKVPPQARRKPAKTVWAAVIVTAVISVALTWMGLKFFGASTPHPATMDKASQTPASGKRIAYWRAPMNPMEIYNAPGKSKMGMDLVPVYEEDAVSPAAGQGKRAIAYWRAPMNPMEIYNAPGKSKMGMDLVPVYEDELVGGVDIRIDPVVEQNMGVRTASVEKGPLVYTIRTYGHITYDETRTALVTTKVDGWLDHLYVNFTGEIVEAGQPLFEIYSPQLLAAQEEYLSAFRNSKQTGNANREFLSSARRRLSYFDVADSEIKAIETANDVKKNIMIRSPYKGVVTQKNAVEGGFVKAGTTVYMVADLSRVWVEAHIFEYELDWVAKGQEAVMTLPYLPGKTFRGKVAYVYPYLQRKTRDVVIRLEVPNPDAELKPDMYADVRIDTTGKGEGLIIPAESVIRSGERNVVFVSKGNGRFVPRQITLGMGMDGGRVQVLKGLAPNEIVVTSGQFMLDSESTLKEAIQKMMEPKAPATKPADKKKDDADFFKDMKTTSDPTDDFFKDM